MGVLNESDYVLDFIFYLGNSNVQVEVEVLVIQGPKLATVMSQVKKLEVSVLVLGQKKSSALINWWVSPPYLCHLAFSTPRS